VKAGRADPAGLPRVPPAAPAREVKGFTEPDYARFLDAAHQQLGGPLVLVWDNLNTHVSRAMRELIAVRDWLALFQLPTCASELNTVESVWSHLKRSLANLVKREIAQLTALAKARLRRMRYQPACSTGSSREPVSTARPSVTPAVKHRCKR
jgi:putative transposase